MGWERRGKKLYYYRSKCVNGRTVKEYLGCGPEAVEAARQDAEAAAERERRLREYIQFQRDLLECEEALAKANEVCDAVVAIVMNLDGYHKVRGRWRKKYRPRAGAKTNGAGAQPKRKEGHA